MEDLVKGKIVQQLKEAISMEGGVIFAYLHGSFLQGEKFNDIDIALYMDEKAVTQKSVLDFEFSFSSKIEEMVKLPIDVKVLNFAPLAFRYQAACGRLLFSRDELAREEYLCRTWSEYFDFLPISRLYLSEVLNA